MTRRPLTFATVVFGAEVRLLELQARSLARHLAPDVVAEIIVIDNGWRPLTSAAVRRLSAAYGALADRARFVRIDDVIADLPPTIGWRSQQIAKLMIARTVTTEHYVLLDAKNHLIRDVDDRYFVDADGRARGAVHPYTSHPLLPLLDVALRYLGADDATLARAHDAFPATATPFVMSTDLVRAMLGDIEERSGRAFADEFERAELTEFFLYSAWLVMRGPGIAAVYDGEVLSSPTVWPRLRHGTEGVEATIAEAEEMQAAFFAVHRTTLARGDRACRARVAEFWTRCGLFDDVPAARRFIRSFRRDYLPAMVGKKAVERLARVRRQTDSPVGSASR